MHFQNKLVLITGGSKGIGLAAAIEFAREGASVFILARHKDQLTAAVKSLEECRVSKAQKFSALQADVTNAAEIKKVGDKFIKEYGAPDYLVNCAGVAHPGKFEELDLSIFYWMMDVNYYGTVLVTKAFIPAMIARGSGHIINVSSMGGAVGIYGYSAYSGSKYAVTGFTDVLRSEMKLHGIKVSLVLPPDTKTAQLDYETQYKPAITKWITAAGNLAKPEAVARAILMGIRKNKYIILCNFETGFLYWLIHALGRGTYPVMDFLIRLANKTPKSN
ncbi:MAG: SDR family oxidoreductase [Anaerolineaceae bacterium]|nr:SDR family oxidoreductase [Anaerolineaceae bacterium]MBN2677610.1 SDR family oxidoreductase [Anaerolineaceae bacterium]